MTSKLLEKSFNVNDSYIHHVGFCAPIIAMLIFIFDISYERIKDNPTKGVIRYFMYMFGIFVIFVSINLIEPIIPKSGGMINSKSNRLCDVFAKKGIFILNYHAFTKTLIYTTYIFTILLSRYVHDIYLNTTGDNRYIVLKRETELTWTYLIFILVLCGMYLYFLIKQECGNFVSIASSAFMGMFIGLLIHALTYEYTNKIEECVFE